MSFEYSYYFNLLVVLLLLAPYSFVSSSSMKSFDAATNVRRSKKYGEIMFIYK